MNIAEIKAAVDANLTVHWANEGYLVHKDDLGQYLIAYQPGGSTIGLTNQRGDKLNGDAAEFFISRPDLGIAIHCSACGSEDVMRDCWATWNAELRLWETGDLQDHAWCNACEGETKLAQRSVRDYGEAAGRGSSGISDGALSAKAERWRAARVAPANTPSGDRSS